MVGRWKFVGSHLGSLEGHLGNIVSVGELYSIVESRQVFSDLGLNPRSYNTNSSRVVGQVS